VKEDKSYHGKTEGQNIIIISFIIITIIIILGIRLITRGALKL